jgi:hypothetical protein
MITLRYLMTVCLLMPVLRAQHSSVGNGTTLKPLSVCTLLQELETYNGKTVVVRGVVRGTSEGTWLMGEGCKPLVTKGFVWPSAIALVAPGNPDTLHEPDFEPDRDMIAKVMQKVRSMAPDPLKDRVILTYTGLFETREKLDAYIGTDACGKPWGFGFGHLNEAPAQIQVRSVSDPSVDRGPEPRHE